MTERGSVGTNLGPLGTKIGHVGVGDKCGPCIGQYGACREQTGCVRTIMCI